MTQLLELTVRLNQVSEYLAIQRHNLDQTERALETLAMSDAFREERLKLVKQTRKSVKTLEADRDQILHLIANSGDRDGR